MAVSNDGDAVGCCDATHVPNQFDSSRYSVLVFVFVSSSYQRQQWGTRLLGHAEAFLKPLGARELIGAAKANAVGSIFFLGKHGFEETHRLWESHLDVAMFNISRFSGERARTDAAGITIRTSTNERSRTPNCIERLHDLHTGIEADVPRPVQANAVSIETFTSQVTDHSTTIPEAFLIACRGEEYVGLTHLRRVPRLPRMLSQALTGVTRQARGLGIAKALKVAGIEWARAQGIAEIRTWNSQRNPRTISINERFGFIREVAVCEFRKDLSE
ncbi:MAG: GNAT family N-acetyltransferase [Chloroflexi bacterium]|nr:GNAT family N-acetyltransferase [Chloroflexota bacterium]